MSWDTSAAAEVSCCRNVLLPKCPVTGHDTFFPLQRVGRLLQRPQTSMSAAYVSQEIKDNKPEKVFFILSTRGCFLLVKLCQMYIASKTNLLRSVQPQSFADAEAADILRQFPAINVFIYLTRGRTGPDGRAFLTISARRETPSGTAHAR